MVRRCHCRQGARSAHHTFSEGARGHQWEGDSFFQRAQGARQCHGTVGDLSWDLKFDELLCEDSLLSFQHAHIVDCRPRLQAMKRNYKRHGSLAVPSPGPPCLVAARGKTIFVHCFPIATLIAQGIPRQSHEYLSDTPDGAKLLKSHAYIVMVQPGPFVYNPAGHVVTTCLYRPPEKKTNEKVVNLTCATIPPVPFTKTLNNLTDINEEGLFPVARGADIRQNFQGCLQNRGLTFSSTTHFMN